MYNTSEEGTEEELRNEMREENTDIIMEELNKVLKHEKTGKLLLEFGRNKLKVHILELFNNMVDKNQIPKAWGTVIHTIVGLHIHKDQKVNARITRELLYCLQHTNYLQT